jgi:hypothetical protein
VPAQPVGHPLQGFRAHRAGVVHGRLGSGDRSRRRRGRGREVTAQVRGGGSQAGEKVREGEGEGEGAEFGFSFSFFPLPSRAALGIPRCAPWLSYSSYLSSRVKKRILVRTHRDFTLQY